MSFWYNLQFVSLWIPAILAIPVILVAGVVALLNLNSGVIVTSSLSVAAVALFWTIYLRLHGSRVLVRAGAWPACGGHFPTSEEELTSIAGSIFKETKKYPEVVGSGWGFFLYRRGARGPRIFLHNFKGRNRDGSWRSGTTINAVQKFLLNTKDARGRSTPMTLSSHPTMDFISLGSWFSCTNHGNEADASPKTSDMLEYADVFDVKKNQPMRRRSYKYLRNMFDGDEVGRYVIINVKLKEEGVVRNYDVQKRGLVVDNKDALAEWLRPDAKMRLLFIGAARDHGIGLVWTKPYNPTLHGKHDPHFCSRFCQFFQVDVCSAFGGCYEDAYFKEGNVKFLTMFTGVSTLRDANAWMPTIWPWQTVPLVLLGQRNFEVFFRLVDSTAENIFKLVEKAIAMHARWGGRSEFRMSRQNWVICWDVSMRNNFDKAFQVLQNFGVNKVSLHTGKFNELSISPFEENQRVTLMELESGGVP